MKSNKVSECQYTSLQIGTLAYVYSQDVHAQQDTVIMDLNISK